MFATLSSPSHGVSLWEFPLREIHFPDVTTLAVADVDKQSWFQVPTIVLSEARGLVLFLVVRGGIGLTQRLG